MAHLPPCSSDRWFPTARPWHPVILAAAIGLAGGPLATGVAVAATIPVTTLSDVDVADGNCSLREAIVAANLDGTYHGCPAGAGEDQITFAVTGSIVLQDDLPTVTASVEVVGPGADQLSIDGNSLHRAFHFDTPADDGVFTVAGVRLLDNFDQADPGGGAVLLETGERLGVRATVFAHDVADDPTSTRPGGAIYAAVGSRLEVVGCWFDDDETNGGGGAIAGFGDLVIADSTFQDDVTGIGFAGTTGGAVLCGQCRMLVMRSTFTGNLANKDAGAIMIASGSSVFLDSVTIADNTCDSDGSGGGDDGGGIYSSGDLAIVDSVIAGNTDGAPASNDRPDLYTTGTTTSLGFNLIGNDEGCSAAFPAPVMPGHQNIHGDWVGTAGAPLDPMLGALAGHGGFAPTRLPLDGSPLLDAGSCRGAVADQRGFGDPTSGRRAVDLPAPDANDACDIGAVERGAAALSAAVIYWSGFESDTLLDWSEVEP